MSPATPPCCAQEAMCFTGGVETRFRSGLYSEINMWSRKEDKGAFALTLPFLHGGEPWQQKSSWGQKVCECAADNTTDRFSWTSLAKLPVVTNACEACWGSWSFYAMQDQERPWPHVEQHHWGVTAGNATDHLSRASEGVLAPDYRLTCTSCLHSRQRKCLHVTLGCICYTWRSVSVQNFSGGRQELHTTATTVTALTTILWVTKMVVAFWQQFIEISRLILQD